MWFNFNTAYFDFKHGIWIVDQQIIMKEYLRGWFYIDLVSIIPFEWFPTSLIGGNTKDSLVLIKLVKLFRLLKLVNLR